MKIKLTINAFSGAFKISFEFIIKNNYFYIAIFKLMENFVENKKNQNFVKIF